jgi:preprotein translocase subunit SecD
VRKNIFKLFFILIIVALAIVVDLPNGPNIKIKSYQKEIKVHRGLDLAGGSRPVYELDIAKVELKEREGAVLGVKRII